MTCRDVDEFLAQYLDGSLPDVQRLAFERHLGECPDCERYLHSYRSTVLLGAAAHHAPPHAEDLPPGLVDAILRSLFPK